MADDIEVTDEMIDAGAKVMADFGEREEEPTEGDGIQFLTDLFRAMYGAMIASGVRFPRH